MPITDYSSLAAALPAWLDVGTSDLSSVVADIITLAEKRIYREVRVPDMEEALNGTISSGMLAVPDDYVELKFAYVDANPVQYLQMVSPSYIYERYPLRSESGIPVVMARDGANFIFGPAPDSNYTIKGTYYKRLDASSSASASPLLADHPDLYLFACLVETEPVLGRDPRMPLWESKYRMVKDMVNGEADKSSFSGNLTIRRA